MKAMAVRLISVLWVLTIPAFALTESWGWQEASLVFKWIFAAPIIILIVVGLVYFVVRGGDILK